MARVVAAVSAAREFSGFCTATTWKPLACSNGMILDQLEPSAQAPCTRTMLWTPFGLASAAMALCSVVIIRTPERRAATKWAPRLKRWLRDIGWFMKRSCGKVGWEAAHAGPEWKDSAPDRTVETAPECPTCLGERHISW